MLNEGDIIEIVQFDENCEKHLRRVKVKSLRRRSNRYAIIGVNMQGKNSISYTLPLHPVKRPEPLPDTTNWFPFEDRGEAEE